MLKQIEGFRLEERRRKIEKGYNYHIGMWWDQRGKIWFSIRRNWSSVYLGAEQEESVRANVNWWGGRLIMCNKQEQENENWSSRNNFVHFVTDLSSSTYLKDLWLIEGIVCAPSSLVAKEGCSVDLLMGNRRFSQVSLHVRPLLSF